MQELALTSPNMQELALTCVWVCAFPNMQVIPQRMDYSDSVREAVELAVMSTVSHPHILGVQVSYNL